MCSSCIPHGRVSEVQRRQMTTPTEANVHALAVDGDFDDCQARLKDMFNDFEFRDEVRLAGVNSINWARVLAQVVYYFTSAVSAWRAAPPGQLYRADRQFRRHLCRLHRQADGPADRPAGGRHQPERHSAPLPVAGGLLQGRHGDPVDQPVDGYSGVSSNFERALFDAYDRDGEAVAQLMDELKAGGFDVQPGRDCRSCATHYRLGLRVARTKHLATIAPAPIPPGRTAVPAFRRRREGGGRAARPGDADDHAGHRASGEIPRCGGGGHRHSPALFPRAWRTCMTGPNG